MSIIYERQHSPHGRIIIHDDCLPRTAMEHQARQREVQRAVVQALDGMIARHGVDGAREMLEASQYNPANWTAEELARHEEAQRARLAWWDALITHDTKEAQNQ